MFNYLCPEFYVRMKKTLHKRQSMCPSIKELLNQLWYICSLEYCLSAKKNQVD